MPLKPTQTSGRIEAKQGISGSTFRTHIKTLRETYGIVRRIRVDGIVSPIQNLRGLFVENAKEQGADIEDTMVNQTIQFLFPESFYPGDVFIKQAESGRASQFEATLSFRSRNIPLIDYKTHNDVNENIGAVLRNVTALASLPVEVLSEVKKRGSLLVVVEPEKNPGEDSTFLGLHWNETLELVEATNIVNAKAKINQTSMVYFVLE
jgi:hypothetical protein